MAENLAVGRKNRKESQKINREKFSLNRYGKKFSFSRKMSQISNNDRKSSPHWDPLKTGDDLEEQWFFIVQINILFFTAWLLLFAFIFLLRVLFQFLFFGLRMSRDHHMADTILKEKNYDENVQTPIFFCARCKTKCKSGDIADMTFKQFSFLDQSSPYFVISLFIIWLAAPAGNTKRILTSNILPEQATRAHLARLGSPSLNLIPGEKASS